MVVLLHASCVFLFPVKREVPPSAVTKPVCGVMGTIRLVAGGCGAADLGDSWTEKAGSDATIIEILGTCIFSPLV